MTVQPVEGQAVGGSHFHQAVTLLTRRSGRAARAAQALIVGAAVHEIATKAWRKGRDATIYSVAIPGEDDVYEDIQAWLVENLPAKARRALTARTKRRRSRHEDEAPIAVGENTKRALPARLRLAYDGSKAQTVNVDGHRVRVEVERQDSGLAGRLTDEQMANWYLARERIIFRCNGAAARDAVLALIERIARARDEQPTTRFYIARWGHWDRRNDLPKRSLETVVLQDGQRESIQRDLADFLSAERRYARIGLPWHRGYVFHGPPGTGKTSLAKALAEHFELDVYFIALSDLEQDTNLLALFSSVEPRSMLVLEDIDVVHGAKSRDDAEAPKALSLSGLLNSLDGLATPHGLITVMTSNDISQLDSAMLRPGRADRIEELGYLDAHQMARLIGLITGHHVTAMPDANIPDRMTHAEVIEAAKPYLDRPNDALAAITELLHERRAAASREAS